MKQLILIFCLCFFSFSFSQTLYLEKVAKVKKRTYTYQRLKKQKNLKLDFYTPKKLRGKHPLLVYVHGGGFSGGKRDDNSAKDFANEMASYGYAVASISYRLTMKDKGFGCNTKAKLKINAFNNASKDISYAIKYLLKKTRKFKINTDKIVLVGSSAGAEAVLNLVYVVNTKILDSNFKFGGVIAMAGAITTTEKITKNTAIPTQLFHGIKDRLVPFAIAPHHYCLSDDAGYLQLYGSKAIANKLKSINESYYLYSIKNGDHSWNSRPMYQCRKEILDFLYFDVLKGHKRKIETKI